MKSITRTTPKMCNVIMSYMCSIFAFFIQPLQEILKEQFGEKFEVASFCIKFNDAVILNIPHKDMETQGYAVHTAVQPCKVDIANGFAYCLCVDHHRLRGMKLYHPDGQNQGIK